MVAVWMIKERAWKMDKWEIYQNGNYTVKINTKNGTKTRETKEDGFIPAYAENIDIKISDFCDAGCEFCHEGSTRNGKHGDILNQEFINTLHPYQEVALGGGDVTSHPDLIPFLYKLKDKKVIANITVNQKHFEQKQELIKRLVDEKLIYGLGISLVNPSDRFISLVKQYPNAVIHVINGILKPEDAEKLSGNHLKILILGYKQLRRGSKWYMKDHENIIARQAWLKDNLPDIIEGFKVTSFDNLAIGQLGVKKLMTDEEWEEFFMGQDSEFTFFIDMVEKKFSKNSTAPLNERYSLLGSADEMFDKIRLRK